MRNGDHTVDKVGNRHTPDGACSRRPPSIPFRQIPLTLVRLSCPDRIGLLSRLADWVAQQHGNLLEVHQFTDSYTRWFFARLAVETETLAVDLPAFRASFEPLAKEIGAEWTIRPAESRMKVVIMVSKLGHCLADLLWRWRSGELAFDIPCVISNHKDLQNMVEREGIEFLHIPVPKVEKDAGFTRLGAALREIQPNVIVLARYMQILPAKICEEFYGRIINIHHSFLPSFAGANPYQHAFERGVKLIGATCHYATAELDAGPIIDQEVIRVDHFHAPEDLVRIGRDCERLALARSVRWHLADRVLIHGNKSIVFRD